MESVTSPQFSRAIGVSGELTMAGSGKELPKVYLYEEDYAMIQELVCRRPTEKTGGELFGLWTNDDDPVLHIVTGQDIQVQHSRQNSLSKIEDSIALQFQNLETILREKFHLSYIGRWQYEQLSTQNETEMNFSRKVYFHGVQCKEFVFLMAKYDSLSKGLELSPYFLSEVSTPKKGEVVEVLPGRSLFRKSDDIANIIDVVIERSALIEDDSNPGKSGSEQTTHRNPDEIETKATCELELPDADVGMSAQGVPTNESLTKENRPTVYIFKEDIEMARELVVCNPDVQVDGDLFGLWTNDGEPVLHIITSSSNKFLHASPSKMAKESDTVSKEFELSHIGIWQYKPCSVSRLQSEIEGSVDRSTLQGISGFVILMLHHKEEEMMSAFLLSNDSHPKKMTIEVLEGDRAFKEAVETPDITNVLEHKGQETSKSGHQPISHVTIENLQSMQTNFVCNQRNFKVYLFADDFEMMEALVLRYPNVETGGDLFGLWTSDGDAVLHIVLGPGQNCKRTGISFYQDIPYLQKNGELLTQTFMLCHIGEWHSHHQLHLFKPSYGDSSTVIRHYPHGTCGFLLIIANIISKDRVQLSPYLYTAKSTYDFHQKGKLVILTSPNAFKRDNAILNRMNVGRETRQNVQSGMSQYPSRRVLPPIEIPPSPHTEPPKESNYGASEEPMETDEAEMH